ncbi:MAG: sugar transferase, partial [Coriobacteriia bacterium]|nr:sugar transferase [Coriobacteriia bacterium]
MRRGRFIALAVVLDALLINLGIVAAFYIRFGGQLPAFNFDAYLSLAPVMTL